MAKKEVFIILAFHAHEPLWDLPGSLQKTVADLRVAYAITPENYLRKRAKEGRNIYRDLIGFAKELGIKVALDITNELLHQIKNVIPHTFEELKRAYASGLLYPLYIPAHHTHPLLLNEEELLEEIRLNQEFLHEEMHVPEPQYKGVFLTENSVDSRFLPILEQSGIHYIVFPHLNHRKADYVQSSPNYDYVYKPFVIGKNIIALPRHFSVSQEIWRPITLWYPDEVKYQGYLMGEYYVFDVEYREKRYLDFPIDRKSAIGDYTKVLKNALENAPSKGLILYIQDLELMDFGDVALEIMTEAWHRILERKKFRITFVTPDEYLEQIVKKKRSLPRLDFSQISWAPEIRLVLRSDGHYPPLNGGELKGLDVVPEIFCKYPFIFWEPGKFLCHLFSWLLKCFGFSRLIELRAKVLSEEDYQMQRFPYEKRLPLHLRLMKRACNWGWRPDEGRVKRPYLHGFMIADALILLMKFYPGKFPQKRERLAKNVLKGIQRLPEGLVDTRIAYLVFGLEQLRDEKGIDPSEAMRELDYAKDFGDKAYRAGLRIKERYHDLIRDFMNQGIWAEFLIDIREHCRNIFLALDHIQRAWGKGGDTDFLVMAMYKYLYDLYPPKFPHILKDIESGKQEQLSV